MALSETEELQLVEAFRSVADHIRRRDWPGLVRAGRLDPRSVEGCDVEWRAFAGDLRPLGDDHLLRSIRDEPQLPLPHAHWLGVWLRMAEDPKERAHDLVAVVDVRRTARGLEWRLYDLRVP